jgi:rod shape-determining protein MreD
MAAVGAACLLQLLLLRYLPEIGKRCDLFTIVVVYYGLTSPPAAAMVMGTVAGLVQDSLLHVVLGMNGFKKTLIGYLAGSIGSLFMVNQPVPRFALLFVVTVLDPLADLGLSIVIGQSFVFPEAWVVLQRGLGNGFVGLLAFWAAARVAARR